MKFIDLAASRQSVRSYSDKQIEQEKLLQCIEAARLAPSACNSQPWKFIVVDEPLLKKEVSKATFSEVVKFNKFALEAPVLVVVTASKGNLRTKVGQMITSLPYYLIDIGIAAEHFCLQATEVGLGTCMLGWFNEKKIRNLLDIPTKERIALVITVGYPKNELSMNKNRKSINEISSKNSFTNR